MVKRIATDKAEQKVLDDIAQFGWHVVHVLEDEEHAPHAFSIGLYENYVSCPPNFVFQRDRRRMDET